MHRLPLDQSRCKGGGRRPENTEIEIADRALSRMLAEKEAQPTQRRERGAERRLTGEVGNLAGALIALHDGLLRCTSSILN